MTTSVSPSLAERYLAPLINLSDSIKLEIISKLSASMMMPGTAEEASANQDLYSCFQGDWGSEKSSKDYCDELRHEALLDIEEVETW